MIWALSYISANWALIVSVVLVIVGLGFLAFFLKNWKAAAAALAIAALAFAFQWTDRNAYQRRVNEESVAAFERLKSNLELANQIADDHMKRAEVDAAKIEELERLAASTPANSNACFDIDTTRRVRALREPIPK